MSYTESYYTILGINYDASTHEIKQAYKKAALRTHPDRALPERKAEAEANFKKVAEAYEILSEPSSRDRYNRFGTPHSPPPQQPFPRRNQTSSSSSSPSATMSSSPNTYFGVSPDSKPFSFQWESSYDSARRAQQSQQQSQQQRFGQSNNRRRPFNSVDPFQLFNEMFAREFQTSTSPSARAGAAGGDADDLLFDEDPFFANHRKMADSFGFGFGAAPGMGMGMSMGMGMGGGMRSGGSGAFHATNRHQSPGFAGIGGGGLGFDSPFASQGANSTAATRRADPFANQFTSMMSDSAAFTSSSSSSFSGGAAGGAGMTQSESTSTRTINGRTETVIRRVDHQGVETVHTITPEGQKVHVNGIEQRDHPLLQGSKAQQQQGHAAPLPAPPSPGEWTY